MNSPLLTRQSHRQKTPRALPIMGDLALPLARVHEICGAARRTLAVMIAARTTGPVFWIAPGWGTERLNPEAALRFLDPGRITYLEPKRPEDLLWTMEEVLRSGAVGLAVADIPAPPALTPVRRLHLAAETGAAEGAHRPIGLILTPGPGGAQGVETRWRMDPAHQNRLRRWTLSRLRARTRPPRDWTIAQDRPGAPLSPTGAEVQENVG